MKYFTTLFFIFSFSIAGFSQKAQQKLIAENFDAVSMTGERFELSELKGKVVVLTFWSTKCEICRAEIPKLNQIVRDQNGQEVVFLAATMNNDAMVSSFTKKNPFSFNILPNSFGVLLKYAEKDADGNIAMGFPTHFVLNQNGEIENKLTGINKTDLLNSEITRLTKQK